MNDEPSKEDIPLPDDHRRGPPKRKPHNSPWLETIASSIGLILTLGMVGFLAWDAYRDESTPPMVAVRIERVTETPVGYTVLISASNRGAATAAHAEIEGTLEHDGAVVETSSATFDYIPGHSERKGGLFFKHDPRALTLELKAKGYAQP